MRNIPAGAERRKRPQARRRPTVEHALLVLLTTMAATPACRRQSERARSQRPPTIATRTPDAAASHPPIECPLRKQGIDPTHLRPFDDVAKYIAFLERADRAVWQRPDEVVAALGLRGTETVVDVGAGSGYFSFPLAKAVPKGRVIAADTEPEMLRHIHHRAMSEGITNILVRRSQPTDPGEWQDADLVFVCDVLHHVPDRAAWLRRLAGGLKPGATLVLIEFKEGKLPEGPPEAAKIPRAQLVELATSAGFVLDAEHARLLPYQTFLVFKKP